MNMRHMLPNLRRSLWPARLALGDDSGATAVVIGLALTGILGFAGLGTEAAMWYFVKRDMQSAADAAAATAGANLAFNLQRNGTGSSSQFLTDAKSIAAKYGFVDGSNGTTVTVEYPPSSGSHASDSKYVAVNISQSQTALISGLFMSNAPIIAARAVAKGNSTATDSGCVLALNGASVTDVTMNGGVNMNFSNCALYDNSPLTSGNDALYMSNNAQLTASAVYVSGNANQTTGITTTDGPTGPNSIYTGVNPTPDPYANVALPSASSCDDTQKLSNPTGTKTPHGTPATWVFCKDVTMDANGNNPVLTLNPGIYIFSCGANLSMTSGTIQATGGVTLVFEHGLPCQGGGNPPSYPGSVNIQGNANISITAPTTGSTAGIAMFQERITCPTSNGSSSCANTLAGTGNLNITGAAYFPDNPVTYSGGANGGGTSQCTQLVASTITFSGNTTFNNNCTGTGTRTISYAQGWLSE
jgi:putative Flp pilus-assembly TadE/G-like protein